MTSITAGPTQVELEGTTYELRRLTTRDSFAVLRIIHKSMSSVLPMISPQMNMEEVAAIILTALPEAETETVRLLASLIGVTEDEFANLPPEATLYIVDALCEHPDLERFLRTCYKLYTQDSRIKALWTRLST